MEFCSIFVLLIVSITVIKGDIKLPMSDILELQLGKCILNIATKYFHDNMPVIIERHMNYYCSKDGRNVEVNDTTLISLLSQGIKNPVIHLSCYKEYNQRRDIKPGSAILILPDYVATYQVMFKLTSFYVNALFTLFGNRAIRIVLVAKHLSKSKQKHMTLASAMLFGIWKSVQIADAIVLLPKVAMSTNTTLSIDIFTWFPKDQLHVCLREVVQIQYLDRWDSDDERFILNADLFPVKDITDMNGCEFEVELSKDPPYGHFMDRNNEASMNRHSIGVYGEMLEAISYFCNITFSYYLAAKDDTTSHIITPIFLMPGDHVHDSCYFSYPYFRDTITWYVPIVPIEKWQGIVRVFDTKMWILIWVTYVFGSFTFWMFAKLKGRGVDDIFVALMNTLRTYLGVGMYASEKYRGVIGVSFLTLWLFFCIQICTAFQSVLTVFLINPGTYPPISSIDELNESGFQKLSSYDFIGKLGDEKEWNSYEKCSKISCFKVFGENSKVAVLGSRFYFDLFPTVIYCKSKVARVTDSVKDYFPVSFIQLGCIFGRRFDTLFHRLVMSGLPSLWLRTYSQSFWRKLKVESEIETVTSISLVHIQGPLYLVLIGLLLAFLVFVCEFFY